MGELTAGLNETIERKRTHHSEKLNGTRTANGRTRVLRSGGREY
jgi:hypothetical protein